MVGVNTDTHAVGVNAQSVVHAYLNDLYHMNC